MCHPYRGFWLSSIQIPTTSVVGYVLPPLPGLKQTANPPVFPFSIATSRTSPIRDETT
jgi:hypothetical protein